METISKSTWLPTISANTSEIIHRKLEKLLVDTTATSSSDTSSSDLDLLIPYTFRVSVPGKAAKTNHAKSPPFYMQLDHTMAVLWHIFARKDRKRKKNIGIGQLQWALYFLKGVKDPLEGTRQADIDVAIKAIEDALIECYAEMAYLVMKKPQIKDDSEQSSISATPLQKREAKIGASASLGIIVKPRQSFCRVDDFNISSLSYTSLEFKPDISTTLEELIKFRNATEEKKLKFSCTRNKSITSHINNDNTNVSENDAYEMLRILREDQVRKLSIEIENLRQLEEATSVRTYIKIILQYFQSFKLWKVVYRIAIVTIGLIFDQFRMEDIFIE